MGKNKRIFSVCAAGALLLAMLLTAWAPGFAAAVSAETTAGGVKPGYLTGSTQAGSLETAGTNLLASRVDKTTGWQAAANGSG